MKLKNLKKGIMTYAKSCLLIDDDHDDQLIFNIVIERLNKSILCVIASNALEGLRKLREDPAFTPDSIFLDLNMPGINGMDCLAKIKADSRLKHIPIVVYTTSSRKEDMLRAENLGAAAYIVKSHDVVDLTKRLNDFF